NRTRRPPAAAARPQCAGRGAAADELVLRQAVHRGERAAHHRARAQAADEARAGRRRARYRGDPGGVGPHPLSSRLYRLAGADARRARGGAAPLRGPGGGRDRVVGRLSGGGAVKQKGGREERVRAGEVTPVVPPLLVDTQAGVPPSKTYADLDF